MNRNRSRRICNDSLYPKLHFLTSYPPANLNRDDLGNPKTARLGGVERLRVSSQSLKRAWRTSQTFQQELAGSIGTRTKRLGVKVFEALKAKKVAEKKAQEWAEEIAKEYGVLKKDKDAPLESSSLSMWHPRSVRRSMIWSASWLRSSVAQEGRAGIAAA